MSALIACELLCACIYLGVPICARDVYNLVFCKQKHFTFRIDELISEGEAKI